jgi:hypothetical protein
VGEINTATALVNILMERNRYPYRQLKIKKKTISVPQKV